MSGARYSATRTSLRTAAIMLVFTLAFTALMAFTYRSTRPAIEASLQDAQLRLIDEVLPRGSYDNPLLDDVVVVDRSTALGLDHARVWRARRAGAPVALVVEAAAPDGYAGRLDLVVAVSDAGTLSGVRVTNHKETPGLGDYIDPRKDRNKAQPWIAQFAGVSWAEIDPARWAVKKDGGSFAYRTGATISARAVVAAVGRATAWAAAHRAALFAAAAGSTLQGTQP